MIGMTLFGLAVMTLLFLPFVVFGLMKRGGRRVKEDMQQRYGTTLVLMSGCGVITSMNRVPGVLCLTNTRLAWHAFVTSDTGEIPLTEIASYNFENTRTSRHRRARKYFKARLLEINTRQGQTRLFVLKDTDAPAWEEQFKGKVGMSLGA